MSRFVVLKESPVGMEAPSVLRPRVSHPGVNISLLEMPAQAFALIRESGPGTYYILDTIHPERSRRVNARSLLDVEEGDLE